MDSQSPSSVEQAHLVSAENGGYRIDPDNNTLRTISAHIWTIENILAADQLNFPNIHFWVNLRPNAYNRQPEIQMYVPLQFSTQVTTTGDDDDGHLLKDPDYTVRFFVLTPDDSGVLQKKELFESKLAAPEMIFQKNILRRDLYDGFTVDNSLFILMEFESNKDSFADIEKIPVYLKRELVNSIEAKVLQDLGELLSSEGDVILQLDNGQVLKGHKAILAARSTFFKNILKEGNWKEKMGAFVMSEAVGQELMRYLYTGKVANLKKYAQELLLVAEKFQLDHLTAMCKRELVCTKLLHSLTFPPFTYVTQSRLTSIKYSKQTWIVDNFEDKVPNDLTELIPGTDERETSVELNADLYPNESNQDLMALINCQEPGNYIGAYLETKFSLLDAFRKPQHEQCTYTKLLLNANKEVEILIEPIIPLDEVFEQQSISIIDNNAITPSCEYIFYDIEEYQCNDEVTGQLVKSSERKALQDLGDLLDDGSEYCDFIWVLAEGKELKAHQAVLEARSSYFAEMLRGDTKEAEEGKVKLDDLTLSIASKLRQFIYTGTFVEERDNLGDIAALAILTDEFAIPDLKELCERRLKSYLTEGDAKEMISLAIIARMKFLAIRNKRKKEEEEKGQKRAISDVEQILA